MQKQIAVIGLGIFGREIALSLIARGFPVLAIDLEADVVDDIKDHVTEALLLDTTQEAALTELGIQHLDTVVVAIGTNHLENCILTTALLKQIGVKHIIARAANNLHERILRQVGAHEVINPEREMGQKIANRIACPGFHEMFPLADGMCVAELPVPASFVNHSLEELNVRRRFNINVLGLQRLQIPLDAAAASTITDSDSPPERHMVMNVSPSQDRFAAGDILLVMGHQDDLNRLLTEQ